MFWKKTAPKPISSLFSLGQTVLNELAECKQRLLALEMQPIPEPRTCFAEDHEKLIELVGRISELETRVTNCGQHLSRDHIDIGKIKERLEHLENNHIQALTRRISSANWQRPRRKDGRWTKKKGGGHASV